MKKLKLDVDTLAVASFATGDGSAAMRGTMRGHESHLTGTDTYRCPTPTCPTWAATCLTCAAGEQEAPEGS
jgi:hypothetical protein